MKHLEFGRTLVMVRSLLMALERTRNPLDVKYDGEFDPMDDINLMSKAYELLDRNELTANAYIEYQVNHMNEKLLRKKGTVPPPFDTWEDSKKHD
jgi:hypothetical protein